MQNDTRLLNYRWIENIMETDKSERKVLVAGGTGFIGKRLLQIFSYLNVKTYVISRRCGHLNTSNITYLTGDLGDLDSIKKIRSEIKYDAAVYMAANIPLRGQKKENLFEAKRSTLDPYLNFLEVFGGDTKQLVYISSIDAIGQCSQEEYDEEISSDHPTPYGLAKYTGEFYTKSMADELGIPYTILRFSQVYGPNEPVVRIIPILKECLLENRKFCLITSGSEKRRFLYIDDAIQAIYLAMVRKETGIFNIAGPDIVAITDLITLMEHIWGKILDLEVKHIKEGENSIPSIVKAEKQLGYYPEVSIDLGLFKF